MAATRTIVLRSSDRTSGTVASFSVKVGAEWASAEQWRVCVKQCLGLPAVDASVTSILYAELRVHLGACARAFDTRTLGGGDALVHFVPITCVDDRHSDVWYVVHRPTQNEISVELFDDTGSLLTSVTDFAIVLQAEPIAEPLE